ncbi:MAG: NAD(P)-binding domain-containing protein [Deltaproteobacteria bacterium]
MKIAVFGTGDVGRRIASRLVELGHEVCLGSRTTDNEAATKWAAESGGTHGTFRDAATYGALVFNCTKGEHTMAVLEAAGADALDGKVLVDVSNPLDFSNGFPPSLSIANTDSLAEQVQRTYPKVKVVKGLNTMANTVMVDPRALGGTHHTFLSSDHDDAKTALREILVSFGWRAEEIVDLGGLDTARGTEAFLLLWVRLWGALGTAEFNIGLVKKEG